MSADSLFVFQFFCVFCTMECARIWPRETVVFPELIEERDDGAAKVLKITEDLTLNLEKSSVVAKEFLLRTYDGHVMQHKYLDGELLEGNLYHETGSFSSLMVSQENGLQVEGVLGPKLRIKPLVDEAKTAKGVIAHILYEIAANTESGNEGILMTTPLNASEREEEQDDARDVVHPEVLIAVDSAFMGQFKDHLTLLRYLVVSMNSVNVRYLTIRNPGVQLKLCAVEVFNEYYESFLYKVDNYVAGRMSLNRLIDYVQQYYSKYAEYDAVYFITGLDIARFTGYYWDATQQGMAYVGGACTARKVALGEDKAMTYKGVRISSHEFGHLFGCPHDGQKYMGYNSERCPWNDGFIMSYVENDSRSRKFSPCCNDMIRRYVNSVEGRCLRTRNAKRQIKKSNFTRDLPGDNVGRDQFCQLSFPEVQNTYVLPDNGIGRCHVRCFMPDDITSVGYKKVFLPDNSPCNESGGSVCINGDCITKKPKYVLYQPTK